MEQSQGYLSMCDEIVEGCLKWMISAACFGAASASWCGTVANRAHQLFGEDATRPCVDACGKPDTHDQSSKCGGREEEEGPEQAADRALSMSCSVVNAGNSHRQSGKG